MVLVLPRLRVGNITILIISNSFLSIFLRHKRLLGNFPFNLNCDISLLRATKYSSFGGKYKHELAVMLSEKHYRSNQLNNILGSNKCKTFISCFVAEFFIVVINCLNGKHAGVFSALVINTRVFLEPIIDPTNKGGDQLHPSLSTCHGLGEGE